MNANDVRLFMEVTSRQAEEAFRRQMDETHRRIEVQLSTSRMRAGATPAPKAESKARGMWWSGNRTRAFGEAQ